MCVTMPNFVKIGRTIAEIWRFSDFEDGGRPPSWIFTNSNFLTVGTIHRVMRVTMQNFAAIG